MPEKDPFTYSLITYYGVMFLSFWGGVTDYIRKIKKGSIKHSITEFIGTICISVFVGVVTFFFCEAIELNPLYSAVVISISANMGNKSLVIFENGIESIAKHWAEKR